MKKETFETVSIEILYFSTEDIITTSVGGFAGDDDVFKSGSASIDAQNLE